MTSLGLSRSPPTRTATLPGSPPRARSPMLQIADQLREAVRVQAHGDEAALRRTLAQMIAHVAEFCELLNGPRRAVSELGITFRTSMSDSESEEDGCAAPTPRVRFEVDEEEHYLRADDGMRTEEGYMHFDEPDTKRTSMHIEDAGESARVGHEGAYDLVDEVRMRAEELLATPLADYAPPRPAAKDALRASLRLLSPPPPPPPPPPPSALDLIEDPMSPSASTPTNETYRHDHAYGRARRASYHNCMGESVPTSPIPLFVPPPNEGPSSERRLSVGQEGAVRRGVGGLDVGRPAIATGQLKALTPPPPPPSAVDWAGVAPWSGL